MHDGWTRRVACRNSDCGLGIGGINGFSNSDDRNSFGSSFRGVDRDSLPDGDLFVVIGTPDGFTESTGKHEERNDNGCTHIDDENTELQDEGLIGDDEIVK